MQRWSPLVQFETLVGQLSGSVDGAIPMVVRRIWGSLSGREDRWVDMTVIKLTLIDSSEEVRIVCVLYQLVPLDALWPTLKGITTQTDIFTVMRICKSIRLGMCHWLKQAGSEDAQCHLVETSRIGAMHHGWWFFEGWTQWGSETEGLWFVEMLICLWPNHRLTLFCLVKLNIVQRRGTCHTTKQWGQKILNGTTNTTRLGYIPTPFRVG